MDTSTIKENFNNQLKNVDEKISQLEIDLEKAKEYKFKLLGGLETLELLEQQEEKEAPEESE